MVANFIYLIALVAASPLILYRLVRFGRYRQGIKTKLFGLSASEAAQRRMAHDGSLIWFHAVSVGEVNLLPSLISKLETFRPDCRIVVSSSTDSGYDLAVSRFGADRVFFCPLDFTWAVKRTLRNLQPEALVLMELELWPNLIRQTRAIGAPVMVANARLSERSRRGYQRFAILTRSIFSQLNWVGCQDLAGAERFVSCGTSPASIDVTGSLKFDNAPSSRGTADVQSRMNWAGVDPWHRVWCVGSTQDGEEAMALRIYQRVRQQHPELRLILVPRHPDRFGAVAKLIESAGFAALRRSQNASQYADQWTSDEVILVDTVGELQHWWGVCHLATVGGSFGTRGGQNMLEPAGYGAAVSFGPNTQNFAEIAGRLTAAGGAVRVHNEVELETFLIRCLTDIPAADELGRRAQMLVQQHRGAIDRTIHAIRNRIGRDGDETNHLPSRAA